MFTRAAAIAVSITCVLAVSACGDDKDSATGGSANKGPIKLMALGPTDAPGFSLPGIPVGAQLAVDQINKDGGVDGHQLELITCNDKNDPNTATQCARQAIKDGVVGLVGGLTLFDTQINPILDRAGIPWVGPTNGVDFSSKNLFFVGGDAGAGWVGLSLAMASEGCTKLAIVSSAAGSPAPAAQMAAGAEAGGMEVAGTFTAPANSADWAPTVASVTSSGADCIASGTGPAESAALVAAVRGVDQDLKMGFISGGLPAQLIAQLKDAAEGITVVGGYYPFSADKGSMQTVISDLQAVDPEAPLDTFTLSGYASVNIVAEALKGVDEVTAASLTEALEGIQGFDTGVGPVVDFSAPNTVAGFERVFNPDVYKYVVKDGALVLTSDETIDAQAGLELVKSN